VGGEDIRWRQAHTAERIEPGRRRPAFCLCHPAAGVTLRGIPYRCPATAARFGKVAAAGDLEGMIVLAMRYSTPPIEVDE
jgi:hypothetical protein